VPTLNFAYDKPQDWVRRHVKNACILLPYRDSGLLAATTRGMDCNPEEREQTDSATPKMMPARINESEWQVLL
jgi:hypothetical protein